MAAITWANVVAHVASLADPAVAAEKKTDLLDWANNLLNVRVFGGESSTKLKMARIYLVAHFATLDIQAEAASVGGATPGTVGAVTSESEGGLSRSYADITTAPGADDSIWGSTIYGLKYAAIASTNTLSRLPILLR